APCPAGCWPASEKPSAPAGRSSCRLLRSVRVTLNRRDRRDGQQLGLAEPHPVLHAEQSAAHEHLVQPHAVRRLLLVHDLSRLLVLTRLRVVDHHPVVDVHRSSRNSQLPVFFAYCTQTPGFSFFSRAESSRQASLYVSDTGFPPSAWSSTFSAPLADSWSRAFNRDFTTSSRSVSSATLVLR